ncbi:hypothetical protein DPMN_095886 [Dreissena polymorpha]|uniref:Uncharacterized protein n=1 Tax=Dreissena polymorpha TaxID=45954 RepID=A0A9D4R3A9_DREPO|nr:hypothetical protein DPMN_095886 [Dreissena polymorpha]
MQSIVWEELVLNVFGGDLKNTPSGNQTYDFQVARRMLFPLHHGNLYLAPTFQYVLQQTCEGVSRPGPSPTDVAMVELEVGGQHDEALQLLLVESLCQGDGRPRGDTHSSKHLQQSNIGPLQFTLLFTKYI